MCLCESDEESENERVCMWERYDEEMEMTSSRASGMLCKRASENSKSKDESKQGGRGRD